MTFGTGSGGRISDLGTIKDIVDLFKSHGHFELDTARMYCDGNTEEVLCALGLPTDPSVQVHTKAYPFAPGDHSAARLKEQVGKSLAALGVSRVPVLYLHAPDHATPIAETLRAVQDLYEAGVFVELGLSNYAAWQVGKIYALCKENGYVRPTIYQGMYNALTRDVERELIPCLRDLGLRFYAYNPLCGGMLTDKAIGPDSTVEKGARFDPETTQGQRYRARYMNDIYLEAANVARAASSECGVSLAAAAHRWLLHHSLLDAAAGDAVIIGASSLEHARSNLLDCEGGPLPQKLVDAFDAGNQITKGVQPNYFR
ncbi:hypothetical protein HK405_009117 [Cladochytrium tenue]|nr:hypothetical protein HK405_009117 [Cladochytrium tenue]